MNHLEAQSYIMPFIEHKVPRDKQESFVLHMRTCKKCHEELEIYYTLMVGMRQLDNHEELSTDFSKDLDTDLKSMIHGIRNRKGFKISAFSIAMISAVVVGAFFYAGFLTKVYNFEQRTKESEQYGYYYERTLSDYMFEYHKDVVLISNEIEESKKYTSYDRIKGYNRMVDDYNTISNIGEDIANGKTLSE